MSQLSVHRLGEAIDALYEAAAQPELWQKSLGIFAEAIGGFGATILHLPNDSTGWYHVSPEGTEIIDAFFSGGWGPRNFRTNLGMQKIRSGTTAVVHERMLLDDRTIDRQPIQVDFFNHYGMRAFIGFEFIPGRIGGSVERGNHMFQDWEMATLNGVTHHFRRIGTLALARGNDYVRGTINALELMSRAAILLDSQGHVIEMNEAASALFPSVFNYYKSGHLLPRDTEAQFEFGRLIDQVVRPARPQDIKADFPVVLRRPNMGSVIVKAVPIRGPSSDMFQYAKALLVLKALQPFQPPGLDILRRLFGLTGAEARMAQQLSAGVDIPTAARQLGISAGTARGYVKSIFRKTGMTRQSELVRLMSSIDPIH